MRVEAENLAHVLFLMFLESGCDQRSDEFKDRAATIELVDQDEAEVIKALSDLHDMIENWQRRRH
jgi:hypothetical protein